MTKIKLTSNMITSGLRGMLTVLAITVPMWLIGRNVLGEAVIGLLYSCTDCLEREQVGAAGRYERRIDGRFVF